MMRMDPQLTFLKVCGPPDEDDILNPKPMNKNVDMVDDDSKLDADDDDSIMSGSKTPSERASSLKPNDKDNENNPASNGSSSRPFPSNSDLNGRLRKLMASYQRENKREEARLAAQDRRNERRERIEQVIREREQQKLDGANKKLNRKEENDFYRAIMAYGVEYSKEDGNKIIWDRFKALARLDKKYDDAMNEFFTAFMGACKKATKEPLSEDEEQCPLKIEDIEETKAKKILKRVNLIKTVRDDVLNHADLDDRMLLCEPAGDLPDWWISGKHDKDLIQGVARHGMARMDYYILNDPELSFKDILKRHLCNEPLLDKKASKDFEKAREKIKADSKESSEAGDAKKDEEESENTDKTKDDKKRRASVSIATPHITLQQMEQMAKTGILYDVDMVNDLMAQTYASAVKWPKDQILAIRVEHIVNCIKNGKFPLAAGHSLGQILAELQDNDDSPFDSKSPDSNLRDSSTPLSESSDLGGVLKGAVLPQQPVQPRGVVKEVESTSKIRALLTQGLNQPKQPIMDEDDPIAR